MIATKYIEVVGLPGSGKTTVAKLLVKHLQEKGIDGFKRVPLNTNIFQKIKIMLGVSMFLIKTPTLFKLWFYLVTQKYKDVSHAESDSYSMRWRLFTESVIVRQVVKGNKKILINDEGMIGRLVVFSVLTGIKERWIMKYLDKLLPPNTLIVYVDVPVDLATRRVFDRGIIIPFFYEMNSGVRSDFYKINTEIYKKISDNLFGQTIRIVNTGTNDKLEKEIENIIDRAI